jgi:Uncharacterized protein conserved in bacteria (DUF2188)
MPELHVKPTTTKSVEDRHWVVLVDDDPTPVATAPTRAEAETAARVHARNFGISRIFVHGVDGEIEPMFVTPERRAPTPRDVKGPAAY